MADERRLEIILRARNDAKRVLQGMEGDVNRLRTHIGGVSAAARGAGAAGAVMGAGFMRGLAPIRGMLVSMQAQLLAFASVAGAVGGLKFIIGAATDIERQRAQLEALTKSAKDAGEIIRWVREQAKATPFEIPGLIEMVAQLYSVGLDFKRWFTLIGDLAVQGGKDLEEGLTMATMAIVRLKSGATGEAFEQLRRLKISMTDLREEGLKFSKGGELLSGVDEALEAMARVIERKFGGSMKKMEQTAAVQFSNIKDAFRDFALEIAGIGESGGVVSGGLFDTIKTSIANFFDWLKANKSAVTAWAQGIGAAFIRAMQWVREHGAAFSEAASRLKIGIKFVAEGLVELIARLIGARDAGNVFLEVVKWLGDALSRLGRFLKENAGWLSKLLIAWAVVSAIVSMAKAASAATSSFIALATAIAAMRAALGDLGTAGLVAGIIAAGALGAYAIYRQLARSISDVERNIRATRKEAEKPITPPGILSGGGVPGGAGAPSAAGAGKAQASLIDTAIEFAQKIADLRGEYQRFGAAAVDAARQNREFVEQFGGDKRAAIAAEAQALDTYIARLQKLGAGLRPLSDEWLQLRGEWVKARLDLKALTTQLAELGATESLKAIGGELELAQAQLELLKAQGAPLGAIQQAHSQIVSLLQEQIVNWQELQAYAQSTGDALKATEMETQITKARTEIAKLREETRKGLSMDFDSMAAKLINAPRSLARVMAMAGITIQQRQMAAMSGFGMGLTPALAAAGPGVSPINVNVKVNLDGAPLEAMVETTTDRRIKQYGTAG